MTSDVSASPEAVPPSGASAAAWRDDGDDSWLGVECAHPLQALVGLLFHPGTGERAAGAAVDGAAAA